MLKFDWDVGFGDWWIGPIASGEIVSNTWEWYEVVTYDIEVKAEDVHGL